jgi:hypothetical protein
MPNSKKYLNKTYGFLILCPNVFLALEGEKAKRKNQLLILWLPSSIPRHHIRLATHPHKSLYSISRCLMPKPSLTCQPLQMRQFSILIFSFSIFLFLPLFPHSFLFHFHFIPLLLLLAGRPYLWLAMANASRYSFRTSVHLSTGLTGLALLLGATSHAAGWYAAQRQQ